MAMWDRIGDTVRKDGLDIFQIGVVTVEKAERVDELLALATVAAQEAGGNDMAHTEPSAPTREERVASLLDRLQAAKIFAAALPETNTSRWLLITVEALAGLVAPETVCPVCPAYYHEKHDDDCVPGIAHEAWRRFTAKGEHASED